MEIYVDNLQMEYFLDKLRLLIDSEEVDTWDIVTEGRLKRLQHITYSHQYDDVLIRLEPETLAERNRGWFHTSFIPKVKDSVTDNNAIKEAVNQFGTVMGRFAELLNNHFEEIGSYNTWLD